MEFESKPSTRLRVQELLPDQFLFQIGAYLQTCAHIEVAACNFICTVEGLQPYSPKWLDRFHPLRKKATSYLIKVLKRSAKRLPDHLANRFMEFVAWIEKYSLNRHIAVHGAFRSLTQDGPFRVEYTRKVTMDGVIKYEHEMDEIDQALIKTALEDADRVLQTLEETVLAIRGGQVPISVDTN